MEQSDGEINDSNTSLAEDPDLEESLTFQNKAFLPGPIIITEDKNSDKTMIDSSKETFTECSQGIRSSLDIHQAPKVKEPKPHTPGEATGNLSQSCSTTGHISEMDKMTKLPLKKDDIEALNINFEKGNYSLLYFINILFLYDFIHLS